jgi:hypothetical protein
MRGRPREDRDTEIAAERVLQLEDENEHDGEDDADRSRHHQVRAGVAHAEEQAERDDDEGPDQQHGPLEPRQAAAVRGEPARPRVVKIGQQVQCCRLRVGLRP